MLHSHVNEERGSIVDMGRGLCQSNGIPSRYSLNVAEKHSTTHYLPFEDVLKQNNTWSIRSS